MYVIFPYILIFLAICALLLIWRRKSIIRKIRCMPVPEKLSRLNKLVRPFGFEYLLSQDIFTSHMDAWQREFGYCKAYDQCASSFNMVLDCEPVYFDYEGRTWMIELWKGQYGINTGAEIGIYRADSLVPRIHRSSVLFHTVPDDELPFFEITLYENTTPLYRVAQRHWWLTGFRMGQYCEPETLLLRVCITFPSSEMNHAFIQSLASHSSFIHGIHFHGQQVSFDYGLPRMADGSIPLLCNPPRESPIRAAFSQWENRIFLRIYRHITKPFTCTADQLLYLYEYLPAAFRHMLRIRHKKTLRRQKHVR